MTPSLPSKPAFVAFLTPWMGHLAWQGVSTNTPSLTPATAILCLFYTAVLALFFYVVPEILEPGGLPWTEARAGSPVGTVPSEQVAGHSDSISITESNALEKHTYRKEAQFYRSLDELDDHHPLRPFVPELYGIEEHRKTPKSTWSFTKQWYIRHVRPDREKRFLITIENLTQPFNKASVMDIKLGAKLYEETASPLKKLRMTVLAHVTTTHALGVALSGMRVYDAKRHADNHQHGGDGFARYSKGYGRGLTPETIGEAFRNFFPVDFPIRYQRHVIRGFLERLTQLHGILNSSDGEVRIVGSSLLFIYEGDLHVWSTWDAQRQSLEATRRELTEEISPTVLDATHRRLSGPIPDAERPTFTVVAAGAPVDAEIERGGRLAKRDSGVLAPSLTASAPMPSTASALPSPPLSSLATADSPAPPRTPPALSPLAMAPPASLRASITSWSSTSSSSSSSDTDEADESPSGPFTAPWATTTATLSSPPASPQAAGFLHPSSAASPSLAVGGGGWAARPHGGSHDHLTDRDLFDVRLIDFAHAKWAPGAGPDTNLLAAVDRSAQLWQQYLATLDGQ
ncbi:hypothetical protein IWQ60_004350 [Tieghemiomyces parasiticus]|uniref:Kinase n=1 Tax=Tieghemiomyces parasiticus TaxID=78921 RepID=A0A9W8DVL0_9FUNG|nr:hypothetical protein IWQ60_004350 [Tieghemiomyces parasiticus]